MDNIDKNKMDIKQKSLLSYEDIEGILRSYLKFWPRRLKYNYIQQLDCLHKKKIKNFILNFKITQKDLREWT
jgi:hypothetical protein